MWYVYQLRSETELLYVGYTRQLRRRLGSHRREKSWWPEVTDTRSDSFATEDEARQREKELWATGRPKYNKRCPFVTAEEEAAAAQERVRQWRRANPERKREANRMWAAANREAVRAYQREWRRRGLRPTTVAGRRPGARWQQSGPGLF